MKKIATAKNCTIAVLLLLVICCNMFFTRPDPERAAQVEIFFSNSLDQLQEKLTGLHSAFEKKSPVTTLQNQFLEARLVYKNLSVLCEYFNPAESKYLNGPAIDRAEEGTPDVIIPPHGFQALETYLFDTWKTTYYDTAVAETEFMLSVIKKMRGETDRIYKFRDEAVWDALRIACVRLTALDITGFDSPVALYSFPESRSILQSIKKIVAIYQPDIAAANQDLYSRLITALAEADQFLARQKNFNKADRLGFITDHVLPVYELLILIRQSMNIGTPAGNNPTNANTLSFFNEDFFDIRFFSPPRGYRVTDERVTLGKRLFYDPVLSGSGTRSCASCHKPELAFTDGLKVPLALDNKRPLARNTPTLWNSVFQTRQFWDSRATVLENQLDEVVHNADEMKGSLKSSTARLKKDTGYARLFTAAYPDERDPVVPYNIANAISSYVRSLVALSSPFDRYVRGDRKSLTNAEKRGFNLFAGKGKCATCHFIPLFNGLAPAAFTETESEILGVPADPSKKTPALDEDPGKYDFSRSIIHRHAFKTPTLRNIALTAPYMHNGVYATLEEVMEFYNNGGGAGLGIAPENQTLPPEKLKLSKNEIADIISFLKALTDTSSPVSRRIAQ